MLDMMAYFNRCVIAWLETGSEPAILRSHVVIVHFSRNLSSWVNMGIIQDYTPETRRMQASMRNIHGRGNAYKCGQGIPETSVFMRSRDYALMPASAASIAGEKRWSHWDCRHVRNGSNETLAACVGGGWRLAFFCVHCCHFCGTINGYNALQIFRGGNGI